ncbi:aldo/keto reductase [Streptomyces violaceorubidus]|uniref:Aldo/keto reductase n=1 Tax=Streptomyces violaceorubidus TaxID=284042 RepID=A0ABV1T243_9ACTN
MTEHMTAHTGADTTARTKIPLGSDLAVGRIGYGSMRLTGEGLYGEYPDREAGKSFLRQAVDAGVDLIDTADVYGPHTTETLIREALHPYPEHLVIATKGGLVRSGPELSTIGFVGNPQYLRQSVHLSARRLGVERIDLYYLHSGWAKDASFADQVGTLAQLREEGMIKNIGLSNVSVEQLREARDITEIAAVTAHYNVVARQERPLLDAAEAAGAVFVPWQPVSLTTPGDPTDTRGSATVAAALAAVADAHGATVPQVALAWLLAVSPTMLPIPATTTLGHLRENLAAQDLRLTDEEIRTIDALA